MAELPHMPLATDAYIADTQHLNAQEHGAYLLLLITAWRCRGRPQLPDDDKILARYARVDPRTWRRIKPTVMAFWRLGEDGFWTQKKQLEMREMANKRVALQRSKAVARWRNNPLKYNDPTDAAAYAGAMPELCQPKPKPINTPIVPKGTRRQKGYGDMTDPLNADFQDGVWSKRWQRPNNNPRQAFMAYSKLTDAEREACKAGIGTAAAAFTSGREARFRPMLATWINQRGWLADDGGTAGKVVDWAANIAYFRDTGDWPVGWGPRPGHPGCKAPANLLVGLVA